MEKNCINVYNFCVNVFMNKIFSNKSNFCKLSSIILELLMLDIEIRNTVIVNGNYQNYFILLYNNKLSENEFRKVRIDIMH